MLEGIISWMMLKELWKRKSEQLVLGFKLDTF
jgi:hypothetical protein